MPLLTRGLLPRRLARAFSVAVRDNGAEALLILGRCNERTDHAAIVALVTAIQDVHPEAITILIRIAPQVAEVLSQHKRRVVLRLFEGSIVGHRSQHESATVSQTRAQVVAVDETSALCAQVTARRLRVR